MDDMDDRAALAAVLAWYGEMGAGEATGETAIDWLAKGDRAPGADFDVPVAGRLPSAQPARVSQTNSRPAPPPRPLQPSAQQPAIRQFAATPPDVAVMAARGLAREAKSLDELGARLMAFDGCSLKATAKNLCFYRGTPRARLMLVGEAPGRDEDLEGKPFVGRAGQLLDRMLAAIGLGEADVHITNIVYWRPPGNRTPTPQEAQACRPFLERQVELVAPEILVMLGGAAAKHLLDVAEGIMRIRGKWRDLQVGEAKVRAMATLHPAYLLRTPAAKRQAWRDLLAIKAGLDGVA